MPALARVALTWAVLLAVAATLVAIWLWQTVQQMQRQVSTQVADMRLQTRETALLARQAHQQSQDAQSRSGALQSEVRDIQAQRAQIEDPLLPVLHHAGLFATLGLLTSGRLDPAAVEGYAETLVTADPLPLDPQLLAQRFASAGIATRPYATALDPTGATVQGLLAADPFADKPPPLILTDSDWITLQGICIQ